MDKIELLPGEDLLFQDTIHYSKLDVYINDLARNPYVLSTKIPATVTTKRLVLGEDDRVIPLRQIEDVEVGEWVLPKASFMSIKYMTIGKKIVIHTTQHEITMHFASADEAICKKFVSSIQNAIACL